MLHSLAKAQRLVLAFLIPVFVVIPLLMSAAPVQAANCSFVLGFKTMHDLIPNVIGNCLVNEHYNPQNGDALQETSKGLLVWRKADNFTAFTDGYRTWVNGPYGLQERLNTQHFAWETPPPAACDASATAITYNNGATGATFTPAGVKSATFHNPCGQPISVMIDLFGLASPNGQTVVDAPTVVLKSVPANGTAPFNVQLPRASLAKSGRAVLYWFQPATSNQICLNVGGSTCLKTDPWLESTVEELKTAKDAQPYLALAASHGVVVKQADTNQGILGDYQPSSRTITISSSLASSTSWVRATVLAHELSHAADDISGNGPKTSLDCYLAESRAFTVESVAWAEFWNDHLPSDFDSLHAELNDIALTVANDPVDFVLSLLKTYKSECGA